MARLRDGQTMIGALEDGDLARDLGDAVKSAIRELYDLTGGRPKAGAKGKVALTITIEVDGSGSADITADLQKTVPRAPRKRSFYWIDPENGELCTEHPQQSAFDFPATARARAAETA
jgi:hypothetical protein